jgi:protein-tyrosine phosphatase
MWHDRRAAGAMNVKGPSVAVVPMEILIVCYGNICRSPMAEALLRQTLARRGLDADYAVSSAGVGATAGQPAAPLARLVASANGLALDAHCARRLDADMAHKAHVVIALDEFVEDCILRIAGDMPVLAWNVEDPYGGPEAAYHSAFAALQALVAEFAATVGHPAAPEPPRGDC